MHLDDMISH